MARIAVGAVVHVIGNTAVTTVGNCLVMLMAIEARKNRIVGGIRVAGAAGRPSPGVSSAVNGELRMCKLGTAPSGGCMALGAIPGKSGRHVVGIGNARVLPGMAGIAIPRRSGIHAPDMAICARNGSVRAGKRESRIAVAECGWDPGGRAVAYGAILRKCRSHMVGIGGLVVLSQMAGNARCGQRPILSVTVAG